MTQQEKDQVPLIAKALTVFQGLKPWSTDDLRNDFSSLLSQIDTGNKLRQNALQQQASAALPKFLTDKETGYVWSICPMGYSPGYESSGYVSCVLDDPNGKQIPSSYTNAAITASKFNFLGRTNWRFPTRDEVNRFKYDMDNLKDSKLAALNDGSNPKDPFSNPQDPFKIAFELLTITWHRPIPTVDIVTDLKECQSLDGGLINVTSNADAPPVFYVSDATCISAAGIQSDSSYTIVSAPTNEEWDSIISNATVWNKKYAQIKHQDDANARQKKTAQEKIGKRLAEQQAQVVAKFQQNLHVGAEAVQGTVIQILNDNILVERHHCSNGFWIAHHGCDFGIDNPENVWMHRNQLSPIHY